MKVFHRTLPGICPKYSTIIDKEINIVSNLMLLYSHRKVAIRTKNTHLLMKFYKPNDISLIGRTIWIPSMEFFDFKPFAIGMLLHELVHIYMRQVRGFKYTWNWWRSKNKRLEYELEAYAANLVVLLYFFRYYPESTLKTLVTCLYNMTKLNTDFIQEKSLKLMEMLYEYWHNYSYFDKQSCSIPIIKIIFDALKNTN